MVKLFRMYSNLCDHNPPTLQTDRRTDGQTDRRNAIAKPHFALKCIARSRILRNLVKRNRHSLRQFVILMSYETNDEHQVYNDSWTCGNLPRPIVCHVAAHTIAAWNVVVPRAVLMTVERLDSKSVRKPISRHATDGHTATCLVHCRHSVPY